MSINYCDWVSGNDSSGDGSYSNPYKTIQKSLIGLTGGDEVRVAKSASNITLTGTVDFTNGVQEIVGTDTLFTTELVEGDYIKAPDGFYYIVSSITDNLNLTLNSPTGFYMGATISGQTITKLSYIDIGDPGTNFITVDQSGSSISSKLKISGGWDLSSQTQTGITCYRTGQPDYVATGNGLKVLTGKQYLTIEKFCFVDFEFGINANRNGGDYYLDINYVDSICAMTLGSKTSLNHSTISGAQLRLCVIDDGAGSNGFTGTYINVFCHSDNPSIYAVNSANLSFSNCFSPVGSGGLTFSGNNMTFNNHTGMITGGGDNTVLDGCTGAIALTGILNECTASVSNVVGGTSVIQIDSYYELFIENLSCKTLTLLNINICHLNNIECDNPTGEGWMTSGIQLSITGTTTIINNYNAHSSPTLFSFFDPFGSPRNLSDFPYRKTPILKVQNYYSNSESIHRTTQYFGCGIVEKNLTGGRTGGICVELQPTSAIGVGVNQKFLLAATSGIAKSINYYVKSINSFDGILKARVTFNGIEVGPLVTVSLTGSYVQHTFSISSGSITEDGVLALEFVATGTTGSVLIDEVTTS